MVGFTHIKKFSTLRQTYPDLHFQGDRTPTKGDYESDRLQNLADLSPPLLPETQWDVLWGKLGVGESSKSYTCISFDWLKS